MSLILSIFLKDFPSNKIMMMMAKQSNHRDFYSDGGWTVHAYIEHRQIGKLFNKCVACSIKKRRYLSTLFTDFLFMFFFLDWILNREKKYFQKYKVKPIIIFFKFWSPWSSTWSKREAASFRFRSGSFHHFHEWAIKNTQKLFLCG